MDLHLKGKKALVTGGTRGIGRAIVDELAAEGCDVAFCARNADQVTETAADLGRHGVKVLGSVVDVAEPEALKVWVDKAASDLGGLDIVVANVSALASRNDVEAWRAGFETDVMATVNTMEAAQPHVLRSESGSMIAISSVSGVSASAPVNAYNPMKSAVITYMALLATNLAPKGVRANTVSPGTIYFDDGVWGTCKREDPDRFAFMIKRNPMGRMGTPEEIAAAVAFLASSRAGFVTGANLVVDGAITGRVQF
ncbi:MAG: SDR family oxidoreductase [Alphaproteobacteria bacterium]